MVNYSPLNTETASRAKKYRWADGVRGFAALFVTLHHSIVAFDWDGTLAPAYPDGRVTILQLPFIRLLHDPTVLSLFPYLFLSKPTDQIINTVVSCVFILHSLRLCSATDSISSSAGAWPGQ